MERRTGHDRRAGERRADSNGVEEVLGQFSGSMYDPIMHDESNHLDVLLNESVEAEVLDFDGWMRAMEKNSRATATLCLAMSDEISNLRDEIRQMSRSVYALAAAGGK